MAENMVIYAGLEKVGKLKKSAVEREAMRETKTGSVSELVWNVLRTHGSEQLKKDLAAADHGARK
jgi:hypothetical protein